MTLDSKGEPNPGGEIIDFSEAKERIQEKRGAIKEKIEELFSIFNQEDFKGKREGSEYVGDIDIDLSNEEGWVINIEASLDDTADFFKKGFDEFLKDNLISELEKDSDIDINVREISEVNIDEYSLDK